MSECNCSQCVALIKRMDSTYEYMLENERKILEKEQDTYDLPKSDELDEKK